MTTISETRIRHDVAVSSTSNSSRCYVAATLFLVIACAITSVAQAGPIQTNQIGSWGLDAASGGSAVDSINGNNGTWQNGTSTNLSWVPGQIGNAANLQGNTNDAANYFNVGVISQFTGATEMTFSAWIQPDSQTDTSYNGIFMSRSENWGLAYEGNNRTDNRVANSTSSDGLDSTGIVLPNGSWYHVALTYDTVTDARRVYINGTLNASDTYAAGIIPTAAASWQIGRDPFAANRDFDGRIDDLSLWTRALTADEIAAVYDSGTDSISATRAFQKSSTSIQTDGMIAHWTFDQAPYSPLANDSKNSNNATLTNMTPASDWVTGKIGGALDFDGTNDYAITGPNIGDGATALTLSVWVKADSTSDWDGFLTSSGPTFFSLQMDNTVTTPGHDIHFRALGAALDTDSAIPIGEWVHYAGVWESGTAFEIYENGVLIASDAAPSGVVDVDNWYLGRDREIAGRYFDGQLDDAALWTRALTEYEILGLYQDGLAGLNASQATPVVPEPSAIMLAACGLMGLIGFAWRRRRSQTM